MLSLFRKIRQKLIRENQVSRYLIYAVGEIFLVVVGILIALQINNWNEEQHQAKLERRILMEIDSNLSEDMIDVKDEIESFETILQVDSVLVNHFLSKLPFHESIGAYLHIAAISPHLSPNQSGYKLLESKGIYLISDDSLRMLVTNLYERNYPYYITYAAERFQMLELLIQPYWSQYFYLEMHDQWPFSKRIPVDYDQLLADGRLVPLIQINSFHASVMLRRSNDLKKEIETVKQNIQAYLNHK